MRVIVMGAGIAGVTTAWELQCSGHAVTVLDRQPAAAAETSYANAGLITLGHSIAWASPEAPGLLLKSLFSRDQAFRLKPRMDWQMLRWGVRFLRQCTPGRAAENTKNEYLLCRYSQSLLHEVAEQAGLDYDGGGRGLLYVYGSDSALREGRDEMEILRSLGHDIEVLDVRELIELEPAFEQSMGRVAGALYCPTDESGDCRKFTRQLVDACREIGTRFMFDCRIDRIDVGEGRVARLATSAGEFHADAYVLATGVEAPRLARPIGIDLPIYPVKGYSATFPVRPEHRGPLIGGLLEDQAIAFSRLGDRLRVTSVVEIAGYDTTYRAVDFERMIEEFRAVMPDAADYDHPEYWACLRPMTPTGQPVVGASRYENLYLNVGHGSMGWTMGCGTARLVADVINGREPGIPLEAMRVH